MATTNKKTDESTFTIEELAASKSFALDKDIVTGCLDGSRTYTSAEAHEAVEKIKRKKVS